MNRTIIYHIDEASQGLKISAFLCQKRFSSKNLIDLKKDEKSILLNDRPVLQNKLLTAGDILAVQIREDAWSTNIVPVARPLDIVYEDEDIVVVNKPSGMPIHPSMDNYDNSMANALMWYYKEQKKPFVFRCINRLDRDTSGLTIVAKHKVSAGILGTMVAGKACGADEGGIEREYLAIVRGTVEPRENVIDAPIARKEDSVLERIVDYEKGERAVTHYKVIKEENEHSLVSLKLETGRTHQIRVHMKHIGYPLIGDFLYNPDMEYIERQALHSYRLTFRHPITHAYMELTAPLPDDMSKIIGYCSDRT